MASKKPFGHSFKYVLNIIAIVLLIWGIRAAIQFKGSGEYQSFRYRISRMFDPITRRIQAMRHNIKIDRGEERRRPTTFIARESKLKVFLPDVFGEYDEKEWKEFWDFIYEPTTEMQGGISTKRYRTEEEIKEFLYRKDRIFNYFQDQHWNYFWSLIF